MNLEEWKELCPKAWDNDYDYLQIIRLAKIGKGGYIIRNCKKTTYTECTPETKTSLPNMKLLYGFGKEMYFDVKAPGNKPTRDRELIKILKSPSLMVSASVVSKTILLLSDSNDLRDILGFLLQERQAGNNFDIINDEILGIVDNLLEYKCISEKQHKQLLINCNLLHE